MCGICGILGNAPAGGVESMVEAMRHRGPDDRGVFCGQGVCLGMTRLAVIDLSPHAHQPMGNEDGTVWIVYNGEMYNFREQREILRGRGRLFRSSSDTEVALRMYEEYGDDFVARMRGMFALAVYDRKRGPGRERLLLARDHMGVKPLLYFSTGSTLVFASEMKAILASGLVPRRFSPEALRLLLAQGSVAQPMTAVEGVRMLLPAHRMILENGTRRVERYWRLAADRRAGLRLRPYEEQVEAVRSALEESVRLQMVSDVPVGAFLSGGVDSSLLVALMSRASGSRIRTFSVGFGEEGADIDETDDARRTAEFLGTDHRRVVVSGRDFRDSLARMVAAIDQPSVDGVNSYFVSEAARRHVTVAVSGTGGDELFAGYPWFRDMALAVRTSRRNWRTTAKGALSAISSLRAFDFLAGGKWGGSLERARRYRLFLPRYAREYQIFGMCGAARLLSPEIKNAARAGREPSLDLASADELPHGSPVERVSALCLRGYTQNQLLRDIDAVSMFHSLEVRVPFLDPDVADMALSLPDEAKLKPPEDTAAPLTYRQTGSKRILLDAGRGLLPPDMDLQPKRGFGLPMENWLEGPLRDVVDDALSGDSVKRRGFFSAPEAEGLLRAFRRGEASWCGVWVLTLAELWCRQILDEAGRT